MLISSQVLQRIHSIGLISSTSSGMAKFPGEPTGGAGEPWGNPF